MKIRSYSSSIGKLVFDENTREPLGVVDDLVVNPGNLKVEAFLIKNSFFSEPKILLASSINRWGKDLFVSVHSLKNLSSNKKVKEILLKQIGIIWKKVVGESGTYLGEVRDLIFSENFQGTSLVVKKSIFGIFYFGAELLIGKKKILEINKKQVTVKDLEKAAVSP